MQLFIESFSKFYSSHFFLSAYNLTISHKNFALENEKSDIIMRKYFDREVNGDDKIGNVKRIKVFETGINMNMNKKGVR